MSWSPGPRVQTILARRDMAQRYDIAILRIAPRPRVRPGRESGATRNPPGPHWRTRERSAQATVVGATGRGSIVSPVSQASAAAAAARPSAIAHTMSDCPRPMSPATKTPGTVDMNVAVARHVAAAVDLDAERVDQALALRAGEAHREEDQVRRQLPLGALDLLEPPLDPLHLVQQQGAQRRRRRRRGTSRC